MSSQAFDVNNVLLRLERLERQNHRLKAFLSILVIITCSLFLLGQARPSRIIEAEKFRLKDSSGKVRGEFALDSITYSKGIVIEPRLTIRDENQKIVSWLGASQLRLLLPEGQELTLLPNSVTSKSGPFENIQSKTYFSLFGVDGFSSISVGEDVGKETQSISLIASKGNPSVKGLSFISVQNGKGKADITADGDNAWLNIQDRQGFETVLGNTDLVTARTGENRKTSAASVVLLDKEGKVIWRAP